METSVLKVKKEGLEVYTFDVTCWLISPGENTITRLWYPTQKITVEESDDGHSLTYLDTSGPDEVRATRFN